MKTTAEGVAARDDDTTVLASTAGGSREFEHNGVKIVKSRNVGSLLSVPLAPGFPLRLDALRADADVVHFHLPDPLSATAALLSRRREQSVVVTYHSDIVRQSWALGVYEPVRQRLLDIADRILVTSPRLIEAASTLDGHRDKCEVVPLGIDVDQFGSYDGPDRDLPGDPERPNLLFTGRLVYYKGVEYLLEAVREVDADLWIAGDGPRRDQLVQRAAELGVADRTHFLGYVPEDLLHYCYHRADVFVFPSVARSEAFGVAQLEAMAYGLPVVNTDLPTGVPWVSQDGETGFTVPPEDAAALREAIRRLLDDRELAARFGTAGRRRVKREFTSARLIERTRDIYRDVLGS